ncbi:MAG: uridine kinase [Bacteroides sp.]|nr:uridine kinase [Bacteroides sp.]
MLIIGIAGGTGSGKTTVVRKIIESLPKDEVDVIPQDAYYNNNPHIPLEVRKTMNYDEPAAIEWSLLVKQLKELKEGKGIERPTYDFLTCSRMAETVHMEPRDVVVVEGILVLTNKELRDLMDIKVFVDAAPDERLIRVIHRDCIERGRTPEMVIERYTSQLKPMHELHIEPSKRYADLIVPQGGHNEVAIKLLTDYIRSLLPSFNKAQS